MIVVIDYRAGNLYNVANALKYLGSEFVFSGDPEVVGQASKVILPGVGSARAAMDSLAEQGLVPALKGLRVPFLGICLGLQLLFEASEEDHTPCLGILSGIIRKFDSSQAKVPQIGWNQVRYPASQERPPRLFEGIPNHSFFYFVHSYYAPHLDGITVAVTEYVTSFASTVRKDNFWGVQFHPERSGDAGLRLLQNFLEVE